MSRFLLRSILILVLLVLMQFLSAVSALAATRVLFCSRLEFTPTLLEMLQRSCARSLGVNDTMILQPFDQQARDSASGSLILVEQGVELAFLSDSHRVTGRRLELVWVLVASLRTTGLPITGTLNGKQFIRLLSELRQQAPDRYPWFESLSSPVTLRNFDLLFAQSAAGYRADQATGYKTSSKDGVSSLPLWQHLDATGFLYRAMEENLLNPFSIEADLGLAMNVFAAGDAMFVSHWVPREFLDNERLCRENLGKVRLLPFPLSDDGRCLRLCLDLYAPEAVLASFRQPPELSSDSRFIELDYRADISWIEKHATGRYDSLVTGDY